MEWLKNLNNAVAYIERSLDKEISWEEAARAACCSPSYFQRMFSYAAGVSLSEYIRRRRMSQAAFELQRTDARVLDIALKYGYASPTAFNRAFQSVHGISPAAARSSGCTLCAYPPFKFSVTITGGCPMAYHIEEKDAMRFVGIRTDLAGNMKENQQIIPAFWKQAQEGTQLSAVRRLASGRPEGLFGISVCESPGSPFYLIAAASGQNPPGGMEAVEIPAASWAVFELDGMFKEAVQDIFRRFFTEWLPFSGYEYAGLPDLEVYPLERPEPPCGRSEVWFAVRNGKEMT